MSQPPFGLLLDIDGPIASPIERAIVQPTIIPDLIGLMADGIPVVFNTGRSDDFLRKEVIEPLLAAGLPHGARIHGVCEKGAVWFAVSDAGIGELQIDHSLALPKEFGEQVKKLVENKYSDTMFYDDTKYAMVSVEQNIDTPSAAYLEVQKTFDDDVLGIFKAMGLGVRLHDLVQPDENDEAAFRIDPTIISTDIENVLCGKDRGAERALELLREDGELPRLWRTVGDSRTDYTMADWLHVNGHQVAHIDVRPADGVPDKPYDIFVATTTVNDEAGAKYLSRLREVIAGTAAPETEATYDA